MQLDHFADDLNMQPWSRRRFVGTVAVGAGAVLFAGPAIAQRPRAGETWLGQLVVEYLGAAGAEEDLLAHIRNARIDYGAPAYVQPTAELSSFHIRYSGQWRIVARAVEAQLPSGAYVRVDRAVFQDSMSPRAYKDVNEHEMRCALIPEVRERFDDFVPFPCGPREPYTPEWRRTFDMTAEFYRNFHNVDVGDCKIDYIRPAQTVARLELEPNAHPSFGVSTKTAPIQRSLLFAPDATG